MYGRTCTVIDAKLPLPSKIAYIKVDPLDRIRNGFANGGGGIFISMSHAALGMSLNDSQSVEIRHPAKEMAPIHPPYISFYGRLYGGCMCNVKT